MREKLTSAGMERKYQDQLLQNYEFYKSAFELSKDPKIVLEDCNIIKFNPVTLDFFNCDDPDKLFNHKFSEFLSEGVGNGFIKTNCAGNIFAEIELKTCTGQIVLASINFDTISKNGIERTIVTIHDISERVQARKNLEDSNEFIFKVMENLPIGIAVKSIDHKAVKYMNHNFHETMGWPKEITGDFEVWFEKAFPNVGDAERVKKLIMDSLKEKDIAHWEMVKIKDEDGNDRLLDITMFLMEGQDSMITMVTNVTQEVKDRAWLKVKSEAVKALPNSIVITDVEGKILWVNPAFTKIYGYTKDEVEGQTPRILKSGEHDEIFYKDLWATITTGNTWHGQIVNKHKDGSEIIDNQTITPVRAGGAEITHFVAVKNLAE